MKKYILLACSLWSMSASGQLVQTTEAEMKIQGKMIDAASFFVIAQYEKAEKLYKEIIDANPKNAAAYYELARTHNRQKQYDNALVQAKKATELDKNNTWYKQFLAETLRSYGKFKEAAEIYEALTKIEPRNEIFYFEWASCLAQGGDKAKAIKAFETLEKKTGYDEDICRQKHVLYLEMGDNKKAERELQKLIDNEPTNLEFYHLLAGYYKQIGDKNKEQSTYRRIISIAPNDSKANVALAAQNKMQGNEADYLNSLQKIFENKDIALDAKIKELIPYVQKVADKGDATLANNMIELVKVLERVHPKEAKVHAVYGDVLFYANRKQDALEQYQKSTQFSSSVFSVWEQIFDIQKENKDYDGLLKSTERALDYFPNQVSVTYFNGIALMGKGNFAEANNALEQAVIMAGKNGRLKVNALCGLAKLQIKSQKNDVAKATLAKAQPLGAENSPEWLELSGDLAALQNDIDIAMTFWRKAKEKGAQSLTLDKKITEKKWLEDK